MSEVQILVDYPTKTWSVHNVKISLNGINSEMLIFSISFASAETVNVKNRGVIPLDDFQCPEIKQSYLVKRICYDEFNFYLLVQIRSSYYHYCDVPKVAVAEWIISSSLGRHYIANFNGGPYDCHDKNLPNIDRSNTHDYH
ncbi:KTSC domain-containing protein [Ahrensia kielensis]|uniref:KTSC domain-containing protein n=1 Tax=Ahrensia kielensis TaxID=76980 RepID=UPI003CCC4BA5